MLKGPSHQIVDLPKNSAVGVGTSWFISSTCRSLNVAGGTLDVKEIGWCSFHHVNIYGFSN